MHTLSPAQAGQIATRARVLRKQGLLSQHQYGLLDCMLWQARKPGSGFLAASLAVLARLAGQARSTATEGIRRLEELGLLRRALVQIATTVRQRNI
jgi:DNA-binding MarR family transcriptional regulator